MAHGPKWGRVCSLAKIGDKFMPSPIVITTITNIIKVIVNIIIIIAAASSDSTSWSAWRQVYVFPSAHDSQGLGARRKTTRLKKYPTSDFYEHVVSCCAARPFWKSKEKSGEWYQQPQTETSSFLQKLRFSKTSEFPPWRRYDRCESSRDC